MTIALGNGRVGEASGLTTSDGPLGPRGAHCQARGLTYAYPAGLTMVELVVVLVILVALAGIALPLVGTVSDQARIDATNESLHRLQNVILNQYVPDMKGAAIGSTGITNLDGLPRSETAGNALSAPQLVNLFNNPTTSTYNSVTRLGWKGPYLTAGLGFYPGMSSTPTTEGFVTGSPTSWSGLGSTPFGLSGDSTVLDGWGNPIVILPAIDSSGNGYHILLSAGPTGSLGGVPTATDPGTGTTVVAITIGTSGPYINSSTTYYWLPLLVPNVTYPNGTTPTAPW